MAFLLSIPLGGVLVNVVVPVVIVVSNNSVEDHHVCSGGRIRSHGFSKGRRHQLLFFRSIQGIVFIVLFDTNVLVVLLKGLVRDTDELSAVFQFLFFSAAVFRRLLLFLLVVEVFFV